MVNANTATMERPTTQPVNARILTRDGTGLRVTRSGNGKSATVVFMHGLCLDHHSLSAQIEGVRGVFGDDVQVVGYDHRGHGESDSAPIGTYTIDQLCEDLADVLAWLGDGGPVVLVGHSLGGMVALRYATANPGKISGLVLCATSAGKLTRQGFGHLLDLPGVDMLASVVGHLPEIAARAVAAPVCSLLHRIHADPAAGGVLIEAIGHAMANASLKTVVGFLPSLRDYDVLGVLGTITADTTVIGGDLDVLTPKWHSDRMAEDIPGARRIRLQIGHMVPQIAQSTVTDAVACAVARSSTQLAAVV